MLQLLKIPEKCLFPAPKSVPLNKMFSENTAKKIHVSEVNWLGTISPISANVEAYKDEKKLLEEIQLLHVCLTSADDIYVTGRSIFQAMRYPCLVIMQYKEKYLLAA